MIGGPYHPHQRRVRAEFAENVEHGFAATDSTVAVLAAEAPQIVVNAAGRTARDILSTVAHMKTKRPALVIGFAAETERVVEHAKQKLKRKGCDWILANDVSAESGVMGGDLNSIHLVSADGVESWPTQTKDEVAHMLIARIATTIAEAAPKGAP